MRQHTPSLAHDLLRQDRKPLDAFFRPRNVALVGATDAPRSVGRTILWNLVSNPFGGTVFPVNSRRASVLGIKAYPSIKDLPERAELAVIATPAAAVPAVVRECADAEVAAAIIISAGFRESGEPGARLEQEVRAAAQRGGVRIVGPNCLGIMNPGVGLNATFAGAMARPGNVAFISQSGALLTAILDWSLREQVGFSAFVSTGSMLDVGWGDLIDYFGDDPSTRSIVVYMESIGDARSFMSAAREVSLSKPIIAIKPGRTEAAARAAASHTGSLVGSDEVIDVAFRRAGVLRVRTIDDVFNMAEVLAKQPRPPGPRLTIVTNAGGPGVLATDELIAGGGELARLAESMKNELDSFLPRAWSHGNPIDILGDAGPDRYQRVLEIAAQRPESDGLLVILTPQDMTDPTMTAEALSRCALPDDRPVLASWMGGVQVSAGEDILNRAGIPTFPYPDHAARAFCYMWRYAEDLRALYETPAEEEARLPGNPAPAEQVVRDARSEGRTLLDEHESKSVLAAWGIPVAETRTAVSLDEAVSQATAIGFPVAMKLWSRTIAHKTEVGGVKLRLAGPDAVAEAFRQIQESVARLAGEPQPEAPLPSPPPESSSPQQQPSPSSGQRQHMLGVTVQPMVAPADAVELIVGSSIDEQFGPVLLFGAGGVLVEVLGDRALALPPLSTTLARRMMEQTKIYGALRGTRGRRPIDVAALEQLLVRFGWLVIANKWIKEIDINPLVAAPDTLVALDARIVLHGKGVGDDSLPAPAIRPYPSQYTFSHTLDDGTTVSIRPIRPQDEPLVVAFHHTLGERSIRLRYVHPMNLGQRIAHQRLVRICFTDYDRELALVVERSSAEAGGQEREIVAMGRLSKLPFRNEATFAILVGDRWQSRGIGTELLQRLVQIAKAEGLRLLHASILRENVQMLALCQMLGFDLLAMPGEDTVRAILSL
ncbi:MAG: bifunctional acetate--CoA ligase family protein/GNAT family N-acetyltransferase [Pseudomonadota bacterium]